MHLRKPILALLLSLSFLSGRGVINPVAAFHVQHAYHGVEVEQHAFGMAVDGSIEYWKREAQRRFASPLLIVGHGGDINGVWNMYLQETRTFVPVATVARQAQARFPGRTIVLICCNSHGHSLHLSGVYHARDSVWFLPDKDANNTDESRQAERNNVGNIYEFDDE